MPKKADTQSTVDTSSSSVEKQEAVSDQCTAPDESTINELIDDLEKQLELERTASSTLSAKCAELQSSCDSANRALASLSADNASLRALVASLESSTSCRHDGKSVTYLGEEREVTHASSVFDLVEAYRKREVDETSLAIVLR